MICLMGPTCAGKTDLAIELSQHLPLTLISVDSAMVYRGMDIGTAKPSPATLLQFPHALIDIRDPDEIYSAADFCADAYREAQAAHLAGKWPLLVGGTMMYFNAFQRGIALVPSADKALRERLQAQAEAEGWPAMYARLQAVDAKAAQRIHPNDPQRLLRALEVFELTGVPLSEWWLKPQWSCPEPCLNIAILPDRTTLPDRIAERFQAMLAAGFVAEVERLYQQPNLHADLPSMRCVGYRQVWDFLAGKIDNGTMQETAMAATRQLAKRQFTWLRAWPELQVFAAEDPQLVTKVKQAIETFKALAK